MKRIIGALLLCASTLPAATVVLEPDDYAAGTDLSTILPGVTLSAFSTAPLILAAVPSSAVIADVNLVGGYAPTGSLVFATTNAAAGAFRTSWYSGDHQFRADFTSLVSFVSIMTGPDAIGDTDPALFEIFGVGDVLLDSVYVTPNGAVSTVSFARGSADIAYLIANNAAGEGGESFILDRLEFGTRGGGDVPEPSTLALLGVGAASAIFLRRRK